MSTSSSERNKMNLKVMLLSDHHRGRTHIVQVQGVGIHLKWHKSLSSHLNGTGLNLRLLNSML